MCNRQKRSLTGLKRSQTAFTTADRTAHTEQTYVTELAPSDVTQINGTQLVDFGVKGVSFDLGCQHGSEADQSGQSRDLYTDGIIYSLLQSGQVRILPVSIN